VGVVHWVEEKELVGDRVGLPVMNEEGEGKSVGDRLRALVSVRVMEGLPELELAGGGVNRGDWDGLPLRPPLGETLIEGVREVVWDSVGPPDTEGALRVGPKEGVREVV
jgi:hypothetical protein